jgi:hypothetical protein
MLPVIILLRVLFAACMVFIIGYVFGSFSKNPALTFITKVAAVLAIVLFISTSVLSFRAGGWRQGTEGNYQCGYSIKDSLTVQPRPVQ